MQIFRHALLSGPDQKALHIQVNDIILIQIFLKCGSFFYFHSRKQFFGITASAVISGEHIKRHGFSEAPWPADTDIFLFCAQILICTGNQTRFIHIDLRSNRLCEAIVSRIQIYPHWTPPIQHSSFPIQSLLKIHRSDFSVKNPSSVARFRSPQQPKTSSSLVNS